MDTLTLSKQKLGLSHTLVGAGVLVVCVSVKVGFAKENSFTIFLMPHHSQKKLGEMKMKDTEKGWVEN